MSPPTAIIHLAQEGNHLSYSRLPTNRNFVHGGPTGRAAQMHLALGKRKGMIMDTPDKKQRYLLHQSEFDIQMLECLTNIWQ